MRIVFMGSPAEVIQPLQTLVDWCQSGQEHQVVAVVSQPPRPFGRKRLIQDPPLASFAKGLGLTVHQPEKASSAEFLKTLRSLQPDIIITAAYGQILSTDFLKIPQRATINIHPSLLPAFRGATPVQSALLEGKDLSGVSILFTVRELDAGNLIVQQESPILPHERSAELMVRLFEMGGKLLPVAIQLLANPEYIGEAQDPVKITHCRKILKENGHIDWKKSAHSILCQYRAYYPWPGSYCYLGDKRVVIEDLIQPDPGLAAPKESLAAGEFIYHKPWSALAIQTGEGLLACQSLKPQGSNTQDARTFCNGLKGKTRGLFR